MFASLLLQLPFFSFLFFVLTLMGEHLLFSTFRALAAAVVAAAAATAADISYHRWKTFKMNCDICAQLTVVVIHIEY